MSTNSNTLWKFSLNNNILDPQLGVTGVLIVDIDQHSPPKPVAIEVPLSEILANESGNVNLNITPSENTNSSLVFANSANHMISIDVPTTNTMVILSFSRDMEQNVYKGELLVTNTSNSSVKKFSVTITYLTA